MTLFKRIGAFLWHRLPAACTVALLAAIVLIGFRTGWTIPSAATLFGTQPSEEEAWCSDHGAPEATCVICRGFSVTATPPSAGRSNEPAIQEPPPVAGKPRPIVQLSSASVLAAAGVKTGTVESRTMVETLEANAESGYDMTRYAQIASKAPGSAVAVRVQRGQRVKKGEVLALIDAAEVGKAKAEFLQAAAQLASRKAVLERIKASTTAGFRNQADLQAAEAEVRETQIRASGARQAIANLGLPTSAMNPDNPPSDQELQFLGIPREVAAELDPATMTSNLLPIAAPLTGLVISLNVVAGEVVDSTRPLVVVADIDRMWVTAEVTPMQAALIRTGQEFSFTPDGWTGDPFKGKVSWISTEVDEKTRTVQVRAELANPESRLLAHMFGRARIEVHSVSDAVAVPEAAVQSDGAESLVFVRLNDEVFRPRVVTLGARADGYVQIREGLSAGDVIATTGSYILASQANRGKLGAGCCASE